MKNLLKLSLVFLLILSSCSKDNNDEITPESKDGVSQDLITNLTNTARAGASSNQESDYLGNGQCFEINYPYSVTDGQTNTVVNNDEELITYLQNLTASSVFSMVLPFDVTLDDGSQQTITSFDQFITLIQGCEPGGETPTSLCFDLNFPVTAYNTAGDEVTVNSAQEFYSFDFTGFVYPISVTLMDGTEVTVNNSQEFDNLYNDCLGIEDCDDCEDIVCFEFIFPISLILDNGDVEAINDYDDLWDFLSGLSEGDSFVISYPISVEFEDGSQQAVNSDDELFDLYVSCGE
jgi:hypothetical protein